MKTAEELFPNSEGCDYNKIVSSFGNVAIQVDDSDYQGDTRVFYDEGTSYGYLQFGWGSCSGCDALQACNTISEIQSLMDSLKDQIKWFPLKHEALDFFERHDWQGDYSSHREEQQEFVKKVIKYLHEAETTLF